MVHYRWNSNSFADHFFIDRVNNYGRWWISSKSQCDLFTDSSFNNTRSRHSRLLVISHYKFIKYYFNTAAPIDSTGSRNSGVCFIRNSFLNVTRSGNSRVLVVNHKSIKHYFNTPAHINGSGSRYNWLCLYNTTCIIYPRD